MIKSTSMSSLLVDLYPVMPINSPSVIEQTKITRKIKQLTAKLTTEEMETNQELKNLHIDLYYVQYYPKDMKYISLFPKNPENNDQEIQTKIKQVISNLMEKGLLPNDEMVLNKSMIFNNKKEVDATDELEEQKNPQDEKDEFFL